MDPIMRAARRFLEEAEACWRAKPGRVLRMVATSAERGDLVKTLRLAEIAPDNRRPFFLIEAPFMEEETYFLDIAAAIAEDYERVRKGAAGEGVTLKPFGAREVAGHAVERAARSVDRAAALLGERLDGALVALVPRRVVCTARFSEAVASWSRIPFPTGVRLAVSDDPGGPLDRVLGHKGVRFSMNHTALHGRLNALNGGFEAQPGSSGRGQSNLRVHLTCGMDALARGDSREAAKAYQHARALCQGKGLTQEEAMVLLGLGGAYQVAGAEPEAMESFMAAARCASAAEAWPVAEQAWLAAGALHAVQGRMDLASRAYDAAAAAAERDACARAE